MRNNYSSPINDRQQKSTLHTGNAIINNMRFALRWMALVLMLIGGGVKANELYNLIPNSGVIATCSQNGIGTVYSSCLGQTISFNVVFDDTYYSATSFFLNAKKDGIPITIPNTQSSPSPYLGNIGGGGNTYFTIFLDLSSFPTGVYEITESNTLSATTAETYFINVINSTAVVAQPQVYCNNNVCFGLSSPVFGAEGYQGTVNFGDGTPDIHWSVANGNSIFCQCMDHTYIYSGPYPHTFTITGTSTNACGTSSFTSYITIQNQIQTPTINTPPICAGSNQIYTISNPIPGYIYNWTCSNGTMVGNSANTTSATVNWNQGISNGIITIDVQMPDGSFCNPIAPVTFQLNSNSLYTSIAGAGNTCSDISPNYTISNYNPAYTTNVIWDISPLNAATITPLSAGSVNLTWNNANLPTTDVTLTATYQYGNGCSGTVTKLITPCCSMPATNVLQSFNNKTIGTINPPTSPITPTLTFTGTSAANIITIDNTLYINRNVTFSNVDVRLADNAQIVVAANCTFTIRNNTTFSARCGKMWNWISVSSPTSKVKMYDNCTLQDARIAIKSINGALYEIDGNCTFNKNHKHIQVSNYSNTRHNLQFNGYICESTLFNCTELSNSLPGYDLIFPFAGKKTLVAIDINNVDNINIGNPAINGKNIIENCNIAINVQKSSAIIKNNEIKNTREDNANGYSCPCYVGTAICAKGDNTLRTLVVGATNEPNEIHNVNYGIDASQNINADIQSNAIYNIPYVGIKVKDNLIVNDAGHKVIANNMYNIGSIFIQFANNNVCAKEITGNSINQGVSSSLVTPTTYIATGIDVSEPSNNPNNTSEKCVIKSNYINAVQRGIYCNLVKNLSIVENNKIYLNTKTDALPDHDGYGIRLTACKDNVVINNTIVAANHWNWYVNGIWISDCINNKIPCNAIGHVGFGLRFDGLNYVTTATAANAYMSNKIYNNRMHNNNCGLVFTNGAVGDMKEVIGGVTKAADNYWTGTYDGVDFHHIFQYSNTMLSEYRALNNKIYVRNNQLGNVYNPSALGTKYSPNPIYWKATYNGGGQSGDCYAPQVPLVYGYSFNNSNLIRKDIGANVSCNNDLDLDSAYNLIAPTTLMAMLASNGLEENMSIEDALEWWKKYNCYTELKDNPEQIDSPDELTFVNTLDDAALGKLEAIRKLLNDSLNLVNAKYANAAIVVNNVMEQRLKDVNDAYISALLKSGYNAFDFTDADVSNMRELAQLCPSVYGPAVYAVRTVLSLLDTIPQSYSSYCEETPNPNADPNANARHGSSAPKMRDADVPDFTDEEESAIISSSKQDGLVVKYYPNPAQNTLTIDANFNEKALITYEVYNALGKLSLHGNFANSKPYQINTENMSNGLYFIKVFENGNVVNSSKITIQH